MPHHPPKLHSPRFLLILALQFIFGLGFSSFLLLPKYLTEAHGADATTVGRIMAAGPLAAVFTMPLQATYIHRSRWPRRGGLPRPLFAGRCSARRRGSRCCTRPWLRASALAP